MEYIVYIEGENAQIEFSKESVFKTISDDGQNGLVSSVWEADKQDGTFRDVSEDIARLYMDKFHDVYTCSSKVPKFIWAQLGYDVEENYSFGEDTTNDNYKARSAWEERV